MKDTKTLNGWRIDRLERITEKDLEGWDECIKARAYYKAGKIVLDKNGKTVCFLL